MSDAALEDAAARLRFFPRVFFPPAPIATLPACTDMSCLPTVANVAWPCAGPGFVLLRDDAVAAMKLGTPREA